MKHTVSLALALLIAWILWSGLTVYVKDGRIGANPLLVICCVLSIAFVLFILHRMQVVDDEGVPTHLLPRLLLYAPWLVWEVVKANLDVVRRILTPSLPISPRMIKVKAGQRSDLGRVIYANSITLTPGTVSVDVEDDTILVHALTKEAADGVETGEMDRRVTRLEGDA